MLPLIQVRDTVAVVCTTDPSVKCTNGERSVPTWKPADSTRHNKDSLVVTVRPLSSSELLRCQGFLGGGADDQAVLTAHAAKAGTVKIVGPGIMCETTEQIEDLLERLQPGELAALGGYVLTQSLTTADPTSATD